MPTTVVKSIKASGGDYTTVAAWESSEQGDLVTADEIQKGELYDETYTGLATIDGSTTDATRYMIISVAEGNRHNGTAGGGGAVIDPTGSGHVFEVSDDNFHAEWLRITGWVGTSSEAFRVNNTNFHLDKSIIHSGTVSEQDGVYVGSNSIVLFIKNSIFYSLDRAAVHIQSHQSVTIHVHNCTGWDLTIGAGINNIGFGFDNNSGRDNTGSVVHCDNVTAHTGGSTNVFGGGGATGQEGTVNCTNCASSDNSISTGPFVVEIGVGNLESVTQADQFVDLSTIDLHLKAGADFIDAGIDLSSDGDLPVIQDIDGDSRGVPYDIGADQFVTPMDGWHTEMVFPSIPDPVMLPSGMM